MRQHAAVGVVGQRGLAADRIGDLGDAIEFVRHQTRLPAERIGRRPHPPRAVHELSLDGVHRETKPTLRL